MKPAAAAFSLVLLAACARTEDASLQPTDTNESYSEVEKVRNPGSDDREASVGEWRRALLDERPALEFGPAGTAPLLTVVCGERGGLVLQRSGAPPAGAGTALSVTVDGQGRQLPVSVSGGIIPMQRSTIPAGDTLIQQLGAAQAPIALRFGDGTPLILPRSPLIGQFAEGCATGSFQREAAGAADGNDQAGEGDAQAPAGDETNAASGR